MLRVFDSPEATAAAAAERIVQAAQEAVRRSDRFELCLSGGRTPEALYRMLGAEPLASRVEWRKVVVYFGDERAVPPTDERSNFRMAGEVLIESGDVPPSAVHRMRGEMPDLAAAAAEYATHLTGPLDLLVLGVGEDGHTASIFPGSPLVDERERRVAFVDDAPQPPAGRLTVTPRVFAEAREVLVLVTGERKARAVFAALEESGSARDVPARLVKDRDWYLDRAAASRLRGTAR